MTPKENFSQNEFTKSLNISPSIQIELDRHLQREELWNCLLKFHLKPDFRFHDYARNHNRGFAI
jgi:hypothetical protein